MKLFNKGHNTITHAESHISGSACKPQKVFTVSDELGKKLKKMYPNQLECLEDAVEKFKEEAPIAEEKPTRGKKKQEKVSEPEEVSEKEEAEAEKEEAESLGVSIEELRELKK